MFEIYKDEQQRNKKDNVATREKEHHKKLHFIDDLKGDGDEIILPKWEWLIISAAALRIFMPIIITFAIFMGLFAFLTRSIILGN